MSKSNGFVDHNHLEVVELVNQMQAILARQRAKMAVAPVSPRWLNKKKKK